MQTMAQHDKPEREASYLHIMTHACGADNDDAVACIYAAWVCGEGALPDRLGLSRTDFQAMMNYHFPGLQDLKTSRRPLKVAGRGSEVEELHQLLVSHRAGQSPSEYWMADILVAGCLGNDHLWRDLGLWSRQELSELLQRNFPSLVQRNGHGMKWKKFFYKQLCEAEGIYTCRAPSCQACTDYTVCFGPED